VSPRLALVGALPFPLPQGSQVYLAEQACALARAGASVSIVCYGGGTEDAGVFARLAGAGVGVVRAPRLLSRAPMRAGPAAGKPLADLALLGALRREHARRPFDALLAHNAEAAFVALALRARAAPVVYVAHTLLAHELSAYAPRALAGACDALGARLDRALARRADAVIALSADAARALAHDARGRVALLPPGLDPAPPPADGEIERACAHAGVPRDGFALYAGNLDRYQDLAELAAAARLAGELPVVVATHDRARSAPSPLRVARLASAAEGRALLHGAACAVLARRRPGGFPVKLLNYMEAARAIVAREGVADGLVHGESAWLLAPGDGPDALAAALRALANDRARAARLGAGARRLLETRHAWPALARETLALVEDACGG
jgi:glycosyltransferase involved in cell wall biosynthesis